MGFGSCGVASFLNVEAIPGPAKKGVDVQNSQESSPRPAMLSVQVMRGIAAIAVVFFHTDIILAQPQYGGNEVYGAVAMRGWLGVNFFFVLSGFIILYSHAQDAGHPDRVGRYLWRRFTRVYPLYWVMLSAFLAAAAFDIGHAEIRWEARHLISAYALFSIVDMPAMPLKVAWTLLFEIKFYLIFTILLFSRRAAFVVFPVWAVAIAVRNMFTPLPDYGYLFPDFGLLNIWNIYFLFGMAACCALWRVPTRLGVPVLASGILAILIAGWNARGMNIDVLRPGLMTMLAFAFALIVVGAVLCERHFDWRPSALLLLFGNASFSIYLIHSAVISLLAAVQFKMLPEKIASDLVFWTIFTAAIGAGVVCHFVVERPLLAAFRGRGRDTNAVTGPKGDVSRGPRSAAR